LGDRGSLILHAEKDMTLFSGGNLSARSSIMASEHGKVTLAAVA